MTTLPLGPLDRFVDGEAAQVEVGGLVLAVVRLGDDLYVLGDHCTHAEVSLAEGEVDPEARTIAHHIQVALFPNWVGTDPVSYTHLDVYKRQVQDQPS